MSELLSKWASELGIPVGTVQKALGGILTAMRGTLPADSYQQVATALPDSAESVAAFESESPTAEAKESGGGLLSSLGGALSKAFGGAMKDSSPLVAYLAASGLSLEKVQSLVAKVVGYLKERGIAPEVIAQIEKVLPLPERETV